MSILKFSCSTCNETAAKLQQINNKIHPVRIRRGNDESLEAEHRLLAALQQSPQLIQLQARVHLNSNLMIIFDSTYNLNKKKNCISNLNKR